MYATYSPDSIVNVPREYLLNRKTRNSGTEKLLQTARPSSLESASVSSWARSPARYRRWSLTSIFPINAVLFRALGHGIVEPLVISVVFQHADLCILEARVVVVSGADGERMARP